MFLFPVSHEIYSKCLKFTETFLSRIFATFQRWSLCARTSLSVLASLLSVILPLRKIRFDSESSFEPCVVLRKSCSQATLLCFQTQEKARTESIRGAIFTFDSFSLSLACSLALAAKSYTYYHRFNSLWPCAPNYNCPFCFEGEFYTHWQLFFSFINSRDN